MDILAHFFLDVVENGSYLWRFLLSLEGFFHFHESNVFRLINLVEKQVGNHLEGVPFYGPRSDLSGAEISNRLVGSKRSNSDSAFTGSSREAFQMVPDSYQNSHLMKVDLTYCLIILPQCAQSSKMNRNTSAFVFFALHHEF